MTLLTIEKISESVRGHRPRRHPIGPSTRKAAVSIILKRSGDHTEALFILRAKQEGDPWSGHMAFPGGHHDIDDETLRHAADRETLEEIGLDLEKCGELIGEIDWVQVNPIGRNLEMVVAPFVYELKQLEAEFTPNYEVADVLWGSLNDMHAGHSLTDGDFIVAGETVSYRGYSVGDEIVWGLTFRMLDHFFSIVDPDWEGHD
ncbi:MAG: CoA pyrophosphatase [Gammaproteobacteria bacterium]|nr:CoA pyrophosphatase [Gammaproteobacteria bacterium]MBT7371900.1 CoA pyrophosphatase [Gammaproteobacteria bacterium]